MNPKQNSVGVGAIALIIVLIIVGLLVYTFSMNGRIGYDDSNINQNATTTNGNNTTSSPNDLVIQNYVKNNISTLAPKPATMGGTFYVTNITAQGGVGTVSYEDGHSAYVADFTYNIDGNGIPAVVSFTLRNQGVSTATSSVKINQNIVLRVGESSIIKDTDFRITFNSMPTDNRCPVDVQCIQAGAVTSNITLATSNTSSTFNLPSDQVPASFGSYKVSIIKVLPVQKSRVQISQGDYVVTFHIESTN